jgi:hypothetical protein
MSKTLIPAALAALLCCSTALARISHQHLIGECCSMRDRRELHKRFHRRSFCAGEPGA